MEGAVCPIRSDGSVNWRKRDKATVKVLFIKMENLRQFEQEYAKSIGVCGKCWGTGRISIRVSVDKSQNTYRKCEECGATGKAATCGI